ncbi:putative GTPase activating protein for Arf-domain-containing protein [Verticillium dahliae]|nr:putative GTPase activating protein for Arf-domain-containing protein [Verticillium dahliae]
MASVLSKRQQARNEKALQDLVAKLGVFLCMRCASIHRKLGTHISKVKSLSMDGWSNEQVENMKKVGNVTSNQIYNPENKKPPVPVDADEADSAMERFIRSKYTTTPAPTKSHSARTMDEGIPPPLPPKTPSKFSFRSASSILPLSSRSKKQAAARDSRPPPSPYDYPRSPSPDDHLQNKPSKVFGASVQSSKSDDTESKLAHLRDMGFGDTQKNMTVLRSVNGSLERAIETLVRAADTDRRSPSAAAAAAGRTLRASRSMTPINMTYPQPIQQQPTGSNPFFTTQAHTTMPQQHLAVNTITNSSVGFANNPFARSPTRIQSPPLGQIPEQSQSHFYNSPQPLSPSVGNPFFTQAQNQQQQPQQQQQQSFQPQPQYQQQVQPQQHLQQQQQQQQQHQPQFQPQLQLYQQQGQYAPSQPTYQYAQRADKASIMALFNQPQLAPQQTGNPYAPQTGAAAPSFENQVNPAPAQAQAQPAQPQLQQPTRSVSMPLAGSSNNPFFAGNVPTAQAAPAAAPAPAAPAVHVGAQQQKAHVSRESMAFADMNWANGRHSPDAFASLSSRHL